MILNVQRNCQVSPLLSFCQMWVLSPIYFYFYVVRTFALKIFIIINFQRYCFGMRGYYLHYFCFSEPTDIFFCVCVCGQIHDQIL